MLQLLSAAILLCLVDCFSNTTQTSFGVSPEVKRIWALEKVAFSFFLSSVGDLKTVERGNAWQSVATSLNKLDGFVLTARAVRDRITTLIKKFSAQNNKEKKLSGEGGDLPSEYNILLQDLLDLSKDSDTKHEEMTEQKKATLDAEKQKALHIRDIAMKNLKGSQ